jgi:outer membrane protein
MFGEWKFGRRSSLRLSAATEVGETNELHTKYWIMMHRASKKTILSLGLLLGALVSVSAQPAPGNPWSLQEAVDYALKNNLQTRQSGYQAELSRVDRNQGRTALLPTLNGSASQTYNFGTSVDPLTNIFTEERIRSNNFSVFSNLTVFSGFQLQNNMKRLALEYEASLSDVEVAKNNLILDVVTTYVQILFADELLEAAQLQLASSRAQADHTQKLFKAGAVPESNVLEINAQMATDELSIINAQNQKDIAQLQLAQLLNLPQVQGFQIVKPEVPNPAGEVITFNAQEVFATAQQRTPEVRAADLRVRSALKGIEASRGAYYPTLSLGAGVFTGYSNQRPRFSLGDGFQREFIGFMDELGTQPFYVYRPAVVSGEYGFRDQLRDNLGRQVSATLRIPILNGFQIRNNVARAKIALDNAQVSADLVRNQLRQVIEQAYTDALAAQKRFVATSRQLEALELAYRNAETRLNSGVMNVTDFNVALNNYRRAQSDLIQARYDYVFKLKILDFYQGNPLSF